MKSAITRRKEMSEDAVKTISLRMLVANVVVLLMCMAVGRAQTVTGTVTGSAVRSVERHLQFSANYRF
jgi:hypothetical protein